MGSDHRLGRPALTLVGLLLNAGLYAGQADVLKATIERTAPGRFTIAVTLRHADSGWNHYANRWEVIGPQGQVLATRTLMHPHIREQPFTRSLSDVSIPIEDTWVKIRAHDLKHGYGGREVTLSVPHR
jgi:hypothetical protein